MTPASYASPQDEAHEQGPCRRGPALLRAAAIILATIAALKLGTEFHRLVLDPGVLGAIDLKMRHQEIQGWFSGDPLYETVQTAVYPPASHAILWPLLGWLTWPQARWLWAAVTLVLLGWLVRLVVREAGARSRIERLLAALMLLSMNASGVCIGNGQLSLAILPLIVAAVLLLHRSPASFRTDLAAAALVLVSLVKPSLTAPFFWLVWLMPGRLRPAILVAAGYVALTLIAGAFQEARLLELLRGWAQVSQVDCPSCGSADLHMLLSALGLEAWTFPASLLMLLALGAWIVLHRRVDIWVLLGVTALAARFWTYHGTYDDVMVVLPMVALFRAARTDRHAAVLLAVGIPAMLLPVRLHHFWPAPWPLLFAVVHAATWLGMLVFLLRQARREVRVKTVPAASGL
ncbi:MAG: DUF2029 domain-containing protein [Planctomycetes bacterium]|nr:DUF2029 domain-containing protein [Planctomycetota bacterium]